MTAFIGFIVIAVSLGVFAALVLAALVIYLCFLVRGLGWLLLQIKNQFKVERKAKVQKEIQKQ